MSVTIWHNPRCSKSRQTLALLQEAGQSPEVRLYLKEPPNADEIADMLSALGLRAAEIMRQGEAVYRELDLSPDMAEPTLIAAMAAHPILIERPIVRSDKGAKIGRPPEAVLTLL